MKTITSSTCDFCKKPITNDEGYILVAIDGIFVQGKANSLDLFTDEGKIIYKNYFVHKACKDGLLEFLKSLVSNGTNF